MGVWVFLAVSAAFALCEPWRQFVLHGQRAGPELRDLHLAAGDIRGS